MRFLPMMFLALAIMVTALACEEEEEEPSQATASPIATAAATPEATPKTEVTTTPEETPTPSQSQLKLEDAPSYLDVSAVLPGFGQLDPREEALSNTDLGLGPHFSEVVVYLSEEPFQTTFMFMHVATGAIEKASLRAELRDEEYLEKNLLTGFYEGAGVEGVEAAIEWTDADVGDTAKLARLTAIWMGVESEMEALFFLQEEGREMAAVFIFTLWGPEGSPPVHTATIGREISARIANR